MFSMERTAWVLAIALAGVIGFFAGQRNFAGENKSKVAVEVVSENADVSNEIDKSFGWAKAPANIDLEAVEAFRGIRPGGDEYPHPMPALTLALKNIGESDLDSFGVNVLILDEENKRRIASYGQARGSVRRGWTSEKMLLHATETDWKDVAGMDKIDFPVTMLVSVNTVAGEKEILRVAFNPSEIERLPELQY